MLISMLKDHLPIAVTSLKSTDYFDMKQIIRLAASKYVHLDSYGVSHETRREACMVIGLGLMIASITVGALLGTDITNPNQVITNERIK